MMNIALFGPPGAGKGTQSEPLIQKYQLVHIAPGELMREQISKKTTLGQQVVQYINQGKLAPNELVIGMVVEKLVVSKDAAGFLFDGFPRTAVQAQALEMELTSRGLQIDATIFLEVPDQELIRRIQSRAQIAGRADDQDAVKIATRMRIYHETTLPIARHYDQQNKLFRVCGVGAVDDIFERIDTVIQKLSVMSTFK